MKRVFAKDGMKTCWSCGSSEISVCEDSESENFKYFVRCADCGEHTLNCQTEQIQNMLSSQLDELQKDGVNAVIFQVRAECSTQNQDAQRQRV